MGKGRGLRAIAIIHGGREREGRDTKRPGGLVDGAESVDFMVSTLEAGLRLTFDGFEILDVTSG